MFKVGDIVRPKKGFIGDIYYFQIIEVKTNPFDDNLYKLQGIKQDLGPLHGSTSYHVNIIDQVEQLWWKEKDIELTSNIKLCYDDTNINIPDYTGIVLDEMERILLKLNNKYKEEKEMDILDIYKERKIKALEKELLEAKENVKKEDEIQSIIIEMTNQVNTILKNQGQEAKYEFEPNLITLETELKIDELNDKYHKEVENLRLTIEEIKAMFELTADYNERMKILKRYDIINKSGKLNI